MDDLRKAVSGLLINFDTYNNNLVDEIVERIRSYHTRPTESLLKTPIMQDAPLKAHEDRMAIIFAAFTTTLSKELFNHRNEERAWMDDWLQRFHKIINDSDLPVVETTTTTEPPLRPPVPGTMFEPKNDDDDIPF